MRKHDRHRIVPECRLDHLARVHRGAVDGTAEHLLVGDQAVPVVELCSAEHNSTYVQHVLMWSWITSAA